MAYDAADGYVLLFGGSPQSDTWEFQAGVWTKLFPSRSPAPRSATSIVYDVADSSVLLFGGVGSSAPIQSITTISVTGTSTAAQASQNLIDTVKSLPLSGIAQTSLLAPLNNVVKILSDKDLTNDISACGKLSSFISAVNNDQRRGILTSEQATQLRELATSIMARLGC